MLHVNQSKRIAGSVFVDAINNNDNIYIYIYRLKCSKYVQT